MSALYSCCRTFWNRIPYDEPVFILAGRDALAPETVEDWIAKAIKRGVNMQKISRALEHLQAIRGFQKEHPERVKLPD